jgi:fatty acid desaturase
MPIQMNDAQHYAPYRVNVLTREQLRHLNNLTPSIAVRDTLVNWAIIIMGWSAVALKPTWWMVFLAVVLVGTRYYALSIIGHDGLHRRLFKSRYINDLWADLTIFGPVCAITRVNRINHIEHHWVTCLPNDPDRHKYVHDHKETTVWFLFFLSGLQSLRPSFRNIFLKNRGNTPAAGDADTREIPRERYYPRDLAIIAGWQFVLIVGLSQAIGWWAYPVLWLLPIYMFAYRADLVRVFCEHSMLVPDAEADRRQRLITYTSNAFERQFFAPYNMNFHAAHHLWPSIPYYNLAEADRLIRNWVDGHGRNESFIWRRSYVGYIVSYWLWQLRKPSLAPVAS